MALDPIKEDNGHKRRQSEQDKGLGDTIHGLTENRPPQRDWRDWFIMATVTSGVGYGLYTVAKVLGQSLQYPVSY